jgi:hypothetical protein
MVRLGWALGEGADSACVWAAHRAILRPGDSGGVATPSSWSRHRTSAPFKRLRAPRGLTMERVEILTAALKPSYRDEDLMAIVQWNDRYHRARGVTDILYFLSKDRKSFVMTVRCEEALGERLSREWDNSQTESQEWFQTMMGKAFESGKSSIYQELRPST